MDPHSRNIDSHFKHTIHHDERGHSKRFAVHHYQLYVPDIILFISDPNSHHPFVLHVPWHKQVALVSSWMVSFFGYFCFLVYQCDVVPFGYKDGLADFQKTEAGRKNEREENIVGIVYGEFFLPSIWHIFCLD